jgi:hypothetical protein
MTSQLLSSDHSTDHTNNAPEASTRNEEAACSSPVSGVESPGSENCPSKTTNPYRQPKGFQGELHPNALFQQTEHLDTRTRKRAPTKAVFNDLTTAHSSITSGSARAQHRTPPSYEESEIFVDDEDSIPLQNLSPVNDDRIFLHNIPLPPSPAAISQHNIHKNDGMGVGHNAGFSSNSLAQPQISGQPNSLFASVKNALGSFSSPVARDGTSEIASAWPRPIGDGPEVHNSCRDKDVRLSSSFPTNLNEKVVERKNLKCSGTYSGYGSSLYHSSLGAAPSGSFHPSSREYGAVENTPAAATQTSAWHEKYSKKMTSTTTDSSLPEGSTVDNIYKHYVGDGDADEEDDDCYNNHKFTDVAPISPISPGSSGQGISLSSSLVSNDSNKPSALSARQQKRVTRMMATALGQGPQSPLPKLPRSEGHRLFPASPLGISNSSSYGDTQNLLESVDQPNMNKNKSTLKRSEGCADLLSDPSETGSLSQSPRRLNPNNPFRRNQGPNVVVSPASDNDRGGSLLDSQSDVQPTTHIRRPLERDVSQALRCVSGYSAFSGRSVSSSTLDQYRKHIVASSRGVTANMVQGHTHQDRFSMDSETRALAIQAQAFYDQSAIAPNAVTGQASTRVRVPIVHNGTFPQSPPHSPSAKLPRRNIMQANDTSTHCSDNNDWETVADSALGLDHGGNRDVGGFFGRTIRRTGSSIADVSDEGTLSDDVPEISDFGSTERIAHHPGRINYYGDYRVKDLKNTKTPVYLPVYGDHKVNGLPSDSTRLRPRPGPYLESPLPLPKTYVHPFRTPPSEVKHFMEPVKSRSKGGRHANLFPSAKAESETETTETHESTATNHPKVNNAATKNDSTEARATVRNSAWMDEYSEPGPAINYTRQFLGVRDTDRPNSYSHVLAFVNGSGVPGWNADGTRTYSNYSSGNMSTVGDSRFDLQTNGFHVQQPRSLVNGADERASRHKPQRSTAANNYPTNQLRPLVLLGETPSIPVRPQVNEYLGPDSFVYRSPLAPPKDDINKHLYSSDELRIISEAAMRDGFTSQQADGYSRQETFYRNSKMHLYEPPVLTDANAGRNSCSQRSYAGKKRWISGVVLCLCNIFPPLLFLYAIGYMDGIIAWCTEGGILAFEKRHKRWALYVGCAWVTIVVVAFITFLIIRFVKIN